MEKLIELVYYYNSHLEKGQIWIWLTTSVKENGREVPFDKEKEIRKYEDYIISKSYWFIERLVREWKIDYWSEWWRNTPNYYESSELGQKIVNDIEKLIIHLSIIDQPIEYLCSILKE